MSVVCLAMISPTILYSEVCKTFLVISKYCASPEVLKSEASDQGYVE